jgi:hypothetical protein
MWRVNPGRVEGLAQRKEAAVDSEEPPGDSPFALKSRLRVIFEPATQKSGE